MSTQRGHGRRIVTFLAKGMEASVTQIRLGTLIGVSEVVHSVGEVLEDLSQRRRLRLERQRIRRETFLRWRPVGPEYKPHGEVGFPVLIRMGELMVWGVLIAIRSSPHGFWMYDVIEVTDILGPTSAVSENEVALLVEGLRRKGLLAYVSPNGSDLFFQFDER